MMKRKICKFVILFALVMLYLIVGGMEHFQIGLGAGALACLGCFGAAGVAAAVGCKEG